MNGNYSQLCAILGLEKQVLKPGFRGVLEPNHIGTIFIYWLGYNIQDMRLGIHVRGNENTLYIYYFIVYTWYGAIVGSNIEENQVEIELILYGAELSFVYANVLMG